jgi:hypothetical protein
MRTMNEDQLRNGQFYVEGVIIQDLIPSVVSIPVL